MDVRVKGKWRVKDKSSYGFVLILWAIVASKHVVINVLYRINNIIYIEYYNTQYI